ncbi:MAG: XkdX family protein [Clostridium sp.]|nr:XkdX family protein [Clostridium sp.]
MNFETIKKNFEHNLWTALMVKMAVKKGIISKEQYEEITGNKY